MLTLKYFEARSFNDMNPEVDGSGGLELSKISDLMSAMYLGDLDHVEHCDQQQEPFHSLHRNVAYCTENIIYCSLMWKQFLVHMCLVSLQVDHSYNEVFLYLYFLTSCASQNCLNESLNHPFELFLYFLKDTYRRGDFPFGSSYAFELSRHFRLK